MHSSWADTSQGGENAVEGGVLARRVSRSIERRSMRLVPFTRCKVRRVLLNKPRASNRYSYGPSFLVINPGPGQHGQLPFSAAIAGRNALAMPQYLVACPSLRHGCGADSSRYAAPYCLRHPWPLSRLSGRNLSTQSTAEPSETTAYRIAKSGAAHTTQRRRRIVAEICPIKWWQRAGIKRPRRIEGRPRRIQIERRACGLEAWPRDQRPKDPEFLQGG